MRTGPQIVLHLVPLPPGPEEPPAAVRLRHVLKRLLRSWGFRCVDAYLQGPGAAQDLAGVLEEACGPASSPAAPGGPPGACDAGAVGEAPKKAADRIASNGTAG